MGVGDVNKDGRVDVLNGYGWWEQPAKAASARRARGRITPRRSARWTRSSPGGAEMAVYDVNGDGLNDVVTSLQAHGWGLSWFEQKKAADGAITFVEHPIMGDFSTKNAGNVTFSQLHGSTFADIDGDGIPDFVTGKRFWSHLDTWIDPDPLRRAGALRLPDGAQSQGAGRRRVRARARAQPIGHRIAGSRSSI